MTSAVAKQTRPRNYLKPMWVSNPNPTGFCGKIKEFGNPQNLHSKDKSKKIIQQNTYYVITCTIVKNIFQKQLIHSFESFCTFCISLACINQTLYQFCYESNQQPRVWIITIHPKSPVHLPHSSFGTSEGEGEELCWRQEMENPYNLT